MPADLDTLRHIVGSNHVLNAEALRERPAHVWDPSPRQAWALVRPGSTSEVSELLAHCHATGQAVVTHGGTSGLAGGDHTDEQSLILSLERMRAVETVDAVGRTLTVQAGCILETAQNAATEAGLFFGLDLGARGSCTIGGNIATNAGGVSVLRYGMMREQVLGLEAVLADGTVLSSMNTLLKNNTGYDLKQLFIGSEGTLGVVTRAVLRLRSAMSTTSTAFVAMDSFDKVTEFLTRSDRDLAGQLSAFEVMWNRYYRLVTDPSRNATVAAPLDRDYPFYALIEARGTDDEVDAARFERLLAQAFDDGLLIDATIAQSEAQRQALWAVRENVSLSHRFQPFYNYDISLPIVAMPEYLAGVEASLTSQWPDAMVFAYGHMADSNLHVIVAPHPDNYDDTGTSHMTAVPDTSSDTARENYRFSNRCVFEPLAGIGGSVSAEHGIGVLKKPYLPISRSEHEIDTMRRIKTALDPKGILNPGKVI